jgi:hypothetical protein
MELETYLVNNSSNKENLNKLRNLFSKDTFVPFIGSGPSVPLGEPDWENLFKRMKNKLGIKVNKTKSNNRIAYPKLFSKLFRKVQDKKKFFDELFNNIEPTQTDYTAFHVRMLDVFNAYVTTNYDSPIEKAYKESKQTEVRRHYFTCHGLENLQNSVVYLHGHKDIEFVIIIEEDYDYFYPTVSLKNGIPILENFLRELYSRRNILFLGFSFSDNYVFSYFKHLSKETPTRITHFWILDESNPFYSDSWKKAQEFRKHDLVTHADMAINAFYNEFSSMCIYPIVYKRGQNIFIEKLIVELGRKSTTPSLQPGTASGIPES